MKIGFLINMMERLYFGVITFSRIKYNYWLV